MTAQRRAIDAMAVIVPIHDEEELLEACLTSIERAVRAVRGSVQRVSVCAVLDACTDGSARIVAELGVPSVVVDARSVGVARGAGVRAALETHADVPLDRLWLAHTDADSVVPPHWLTHQRRLALRGADAAIGTVRPDFRDLTPAQTAAWRATHTPGVANGHVHGANLGMRAEALIDAGGFEAIAEHEDVRVVDALRARGARLVASDAAWVLTSGRQVGRTAGGYARYLREDLVSAARAAAIPTT